MKRSPELKRELASNIDAERLEKKLSEEIRYAQYDADPKARREQVRDQYGAEEERIHALHQDLAALQADAEDLDDEAFDAEFARIESEIASVEQRISRHSDEVHKWADIVDMEQIRGYEDFMEKWPLYWMPRKKDIGRILSVAVHLHEARVAAGEKGPEDPIRIIDVGGANAALAQLCLALAKENGLRVEYTIVDPETTTVEKARQTFADMPGLEIIEGTAADAGALAHEADPETWRKLEARRTRLQEGQHRVKDARALKDILKKRDEMDFLDEEDMRRYADILRKDFDIDLPAAAFQDQESFMEHIDGVWDPQEGEPKGLGPATFERAQRQTKEETTEIERALREKTPTHDLLINSWMPPGIDFTQDLRAVNAAGIVYVAETWGATGIQEHARWPGKPANVGEEDSYGTGELYDMSHGWIGHSLPQLRSRAFLEEDRNRQTFPFANTFLVQSHRRYREGSGADLSFSQQILDVQGEYPWEKDLTEKTGEGSDITPLRNGVDWHTDISRLQERTVARNRRAKGLREDDY